MRYFHATKSLAVYGIMIHYDYLFKVLNLKKISGLLQKGITKH